MTSTKPKLPGATPVVAEHQQPQPVAEPQEAAAERPATVVLPAALVSEPEADPEGMGVAEPEAADLFDDPITSPALPASSRAAVVARIATSSAAGEPPAAVAAAGAQPGPVPGPVAAAQPLNGRKPERVKPWLVSRDELVFEVIQMARRSLIEGMVGGPLRDALDRLDQHDRWHAKQAEQAELERLGVPQG